MQWKILLCILTISFLSCNDIEEVFNEKKKEITYSYSCLDSAIGGKPVNKNLEKAGDLIRNLAVSKKSVTDSMQTAYGAAFHEQMTKGGQFKVRTDNVAVQNKLNAILDNLLAARSAPSAIRYAVYILKDTSINAFTFGGRIYITDAMLQKCKGKEALLHAIIGHEVGHSEEGHIKATIQEMELSNKIFGEKNGATFFELKKFLTASFNQKNELEADYYGINLTNKLGYDVCTAVTFWKEMASRENKYSQLEDFFRTHPFSGLRAECLTSHIRNNFGKECGKLNDATTMPQVPDQ